MVYTPKGGLSCVYAKGVILFFLVLCNTCGPDPRTASEISDRVEIDRFQRNMCVSERIHHPVGRFFVGLFVVWVVYTPDVCFQRFLCVCAYTPPVVASGCAWCIRQMCVFLDFMCFCVYTTQRDFLKAKGVVNRRISSVGRPEARPSLAGPPACGTPGVALAGPAWAGLAWPGPPAPDQPGLP